MSFGEEYRGIVSHYEACLERFGDTHRGVDWPDETGAATRYQVMFDVIREKDTPVSLLDFGCGASHFYEWMLRGDVKHVSYSGLDLSKRFVDLSRQKFPELTVYHADVLVEPAAVPDFDYIVMNGVFTEKCQLSQESMVSYFERLVPTVFAKARRGIAFNLMSTHVDWEREDLFHLSHDALADFLIRNVSRHYAIRADYKLYEYTTYVYR
jgi:SAM-dependent methyltransferase